MFKNTDWGDVFLGLLFAFLITVVIMITLSFNGDKRTLRYSLSQTGSTAKPAICKEINWSFDEDIILDREISLDSAIRLIEKLNATIKK